MKKSMFRLFLLSLFPLGILINYLSYLNPQLTENLYSLKINKFSIMTLSHLTNFIPFSLYEITLIVSILGFIAFLILTVIKTIKNKSNAKRYIMNFILNCAVVLSIVYFLFIALWGLNYNRVPIDNALGIKRELYSTKELAELYSYLIENVNNLREDMPEDSDGIATNYGDYKNILKRAELGYDAISHKYTTLSGSYGSPKPFIFSEFFNYTGITGIYFPYTGQPGVAVKGPSITIPFTALHEMAHQRGYASEEECNFIAFITGINHPDIDFKYSAYMQALSYTSNALYLEDIELLKKLNEGLSPKVKEDILYKNKFWDKYEGKIDNISSKINDTFLKSNGVADGEKSYGRVVDLLATYYKHKIKK